LISGFKRRSKAAQDATPKYPVSCSSTDSKAIPSMKQMLYQFETLASPLSKTSVDSWFNLSKPVIEGPLAADNEQSLGDDEAVSANNPPTQTTTTSPPLPADETTCNVFGFFMTDGSSIDGKKAYVGHLTVPEGFLRILLRRYPTGKIFNFTADGRHVSDTETDEDLIHVPAPVQDAPPRIRRKRYNTYSRANDADLIIKVFPGARNILAFPLWDSRREHWFAGGVAWTRTPTRVFSIEGELRYLRAFGMVTMAKIERMDASIRRPY
jgi:hypothetical protein